MDSRKWRLRKAGKLRFKKRIERWEYRICMYAEIGKPFDSKRILCRNCTVKNPHKFIYIYIFILIYVKAAKNSTLKGNYFAPKKLYSLSVVQWTMSIRGKNLLTILALHYAEVNDSAQFAICYAGHYFFSYLYGSVVIEVRA